MKTFDEYQEAMQRTYKSDRIFNHALGLGGETGEVLELIKKSFFHERPYDDETMAKELGDCLWYLTALAQDHDLKLSDIAEKNVEKLRARYPDGFVKGGGIR